MSSTDPPRAPELGRVARDLAFLVRAGLLASAVPVLMRALPLPTALRVIDGAPRLPVGLPSLARMVRLTDGLLRVDRGPLHPNCVVRSLVLMRYLHHAGDPVVVRFGVRRGDGALDGHAWIERDGEPLVEARDPRPLYRVMYSWPGEGSR